MSNIKFQGNASGTGTTTLQTANTNTDTTFTLPGTDGTNGQALTTNGSGVLAWSTLTTSPGGSTTQIQFNNSGSFGGSSNLTWDGTNVQIGATGALRFADTDSSNYVGFKSPGTVATNVTFTLPAADGTSGQAIVTDGSGNLTFGNAGISTGKSIAMAMIFGF